MSRDEAFRAVDSLASWSDWQPFSEVASSAPRVPGVYLFRLPDTHDVVYVGMAGERAGSGVPQGLRGRLSIYSRGRGAVSGFGEAALDRALADISFLETRISELRSQGPKRAKIWAQEAIGWLSPEVRWAECVDGGEALALETQIEGLLGPFGLWNRVSEKARARAGGRADDTETKTPLGAHTFSTHGFVINLDLLYRAMYHHSTLIDGERIFNGLAKDVPAVKRLINTLFGVPVQDKIHPVNSAVRSACRDRMGDLGWATKKPGRSAKYVMHRELSSSVES